MEETLLPVVRRLATYFLADTLQTLCGGRYHLGLEVRVTGDYLLSAQIELVERYPLDTASEMPALNLDCASERLSLLAALGARGLFDAPLLQRLGYHFPSLEEPGIWQHLHDTSLSVDAVLAQLIRGVLMQASDLAFAELYERSDTGRDAVRVAPPSALNYSACLGMTEGPPAPLRDFNPERRFTLFFVADALQLQLHSPDYGMNYFVLPTRTLLLLAEIALRLPQSEVFECLKISSDTEGVSHADLLFRWFRTRCRTRSTQVADFPFPRHDAPTQAEHGAAILEAFPPPEGLDEADYCTALRIISWEWRDFPGSNAGYQTWLMARDWRAGATYSTPPEREDDEHGGCWGLGLGVSSGRFLVSDPTNLPVLYIDTVPLVLFTQAERDIARRRLDRMLG